MCLQLQKNHTKVPIITMHPSSLIYIPKIKSNASLRLICFPYAGGSSATFMSWSSLLPADVELAVVQLPGRGVRLVETPYQAMDELVQNLLVAFEKLSHKPFIFYGHSMGARVAYELMLKLHRFQYRLPVHFVASGSVAPFVPREDQTYNLPDDQFIEKLNRLNGTPKEVLSNPELIQLMLPALRADFRIIDTYCNKQKLVTPTKLSVLAGDKDEEVEQKELEGWFQLFESNTGIDWIPGDHFFVDKNRTDTLKVVNNILKLYTKSLQAKAVTQPTGAAY